MSYWVNGKEVSFTDEIRDIMSGELGCDDQSLREHLQYVIPRIKSNMSFVNNVAEKGITNANILETANKLQARSDFFGAFVDWCKEQRGITI